MSSNVIQPSFAAGELSPSLFARVDLAKYKVGAARMRNIFVDYRGGALTRPGTQFITQVGNTAYPVRLIPFEFSTQQTYVLELGQNYMRFISNGALVMSGGSPYQIATPWAAADLPLLKFAQSADVMTFTHPSYPPYDLKRLGATNWTLTIPGFAPTLGAPTITGANPSVLPNRQVEGPTAYTYVATAVQTGTTPQESLPSAPFTCANAVSMSSNGNSYVTLTWEAVAGANYYNIYRQPEVPSGEPSEGALFGLIGTATGTMYRDSNGSPDFSKTPPQANNPFGNGVIGSITITNGGSGYSDRTTVTISDPTGVGAQCAPVIVGGVITSITVENGGFGYSSPSVVITDPGSAPIASVTVLSGGKNYSDVVYCYIIDPTGYGATLGVSGYSSGVITAIAVNVAGAYYTNPSVVITDPGGTGSGAAATASLGTSESGSGAAATAVVTNPNNFPGCVSYFQQRKVFAASNTFPETFWMTKPGNYNDMSVSLPTQADDAITATIAATQVNAIKAMVPMPSGLIMLSSSGAWQISGGQAGSAISASDIVAQAQAYVGCNDIPPLTINYDVLFIESKGNTVRDLSYNFYVNIYTGTDLTVLSNHLFENQQIKEWAWAEEPYRVVWCIRDDGILLSLTYLKEQDVYAWARHDTQGIFESVASISEGDVNAVYFVVNRFVGGAWVRYIERLADRRMGENLALGIPADVTQAWCVDAGLQFPQWEPSATLTAAAATGTANITGTDLIAGGSGYTAPVLNVTDPTGTGAVLQAVLTGGVITGVTVVSAGSGYTRPQVTIQDATGTGAVIQAIVTNKVTMTTDAAVFEPAHVGAVLRVGGGWGVLTDYVSATQVLVDIKQPITALIPNDPNGLPLPAASGAWTLVGYVTKVTGLNHLIGKQVSILADGNVQPSQVVAADGSVTLQEPASSIIVGLGFQCQLQTLPLDVGEPTIQGKRKKISALTVRCVNTRGLKMGATWNTLVEHKDRGNQPMGQAVPLFTGDQRIIMDPLWHEPGQICMQVDDPLPAGILGVIPEVAIGDSP